LIFYFIYKVANSASKCHVPEQMNLIILINFILFTTYVVYTGYKKCFNPTLYVPASDGGAINCESMYTVITYY